jgi:hypothetical protein
MSEANTPFFPGRARLKLEGTVVSCLLATMAIGGVTCGADEITTLDGKRYEEVSDIKKLPDAILFSHTTTTGVHRAKVFFSSLSEELKQKYNYDPFEEGFYLARQNRPVTLGLNKAFRLSDLAAAKKRAKEEKKLIGFVMVWDSMFGPGQPMGQGGRNALAGFYTVFNKALVLVFVRHEDELDKVPEAVKKGFFGPDEGGWAPNMAVVTGDCSQFICEVPLGGENSDGLVREKIFRAKAAEIQKFVESQKAAK